VEATVAFGRDPGDGGYALSVGLVVTWPGIDPVVAAPLLEKAGSLSPYAKMPGKDAPATITLAVV
jgi:hypothetical protein